MAWDLRCLKLAWKLKHGSTISPVASLAQVACVCGLRAPGARNTARSTLHCGFWQGRTFPGAEGPGDCQGWTKKASAWDSRRQILIFRETGIGSRRSSAPRLVPGFRPRYTNPKPCETPKTPETPETSQTPKTPETPKPASTPKT